MSNLFKLNLYDYIKGFIVAVITAILTAIMPIIQTGKLPDLATLKTIAISAVAAGIAYLLKNLFTNSDGELAKPETADEDI